MKQLISSGVGAVGGQLHISIVIGTHEYMIFLEHQWLWVTVAGRGV